MVMPCLEEAAPLTTPHRDGWRAEHLLALSANLGFAEALTDLIGALAAGDVTDATCDLHSSATLVVLLIKLEAEMAALREAQGDAYLQPHRPLGMGVAITMLAASGVLGVVKAAVGIAAGPHQFDINVKGGDIVQRILQIIMEAELDLSRVCMDAANAFNDL
jgi:hypothetical protein